MTPPMTDSTLPELPEPAHYGPSGTGAYFHSYTAAQMREYARAALSTASARPDAPPSMCEPCTRFASRFRCNTPEECDCPKCQGYCWCGDPSASAPEALSLASEPSDEQLVKLAIEYGFGTEVVEAGYENNVLWFDGNPLPLLRAALASHAETAPQADDWKKPTTYLLRFGDALQLLCRGHRPSDALMTAWLDSDDESLQAFCVEHGPAWAQGIGLIDAARIAADQPTEGIDHEYRDDRQTAPQAAPAAAHDGPQVLRMEWKPGPVTLEDIEAFARIHPGGYFLKGSGILKLIDALRAARQQESTR